MLLLMLAVLVATITATPVCAQSPTTFTYHDANGSFPPGGMMDPDWGQGAGGAWTGEGGWQADKGSWMVYILPYAEQDNLYRQIAQFGLNTPKIDTITASDSSA